MSHLSPGEFSKAIVTPDASKCASLLLLGNRQSSMPGAAASCRPLSGLMSILMAGDAADATPEDARRTTVNNRKRSIGDSPGKWWPESYRTAAGRATYGLNAI